MRVFFVIDWEDQNNSVTIDCLNGFLLFGRRHEKNLTPMAGFVTFQSQFKRKAVPRATFQCRSTGGVSQFALILWSDNNFH